MNDRYKDRLFSYYSSVEEAKIDWLWYPYIPYGKLTIIEGDPGEGKSTFMLHIAALLTKGSVMPDGSVGHPPMTVIYQCHEDDISDTIKPRLISAGADCDRVAYIVGDAVPLNFEDPRIEKTIEKTGARLMIFDPMQSFLAQDTDIHSVGRMRSILGKLAGVAAKTKCAIVLIGHMNKSNSGKSLYRGLGSIDISAIARSVLMVARDSDDPTIRYMFPIKSNLAPEGPAIGFKFDRLRGFVWLGVCNANVNTDRNTVSPLGEKSCEATEVIMTILQSGPVPSAEIFERMSMLGVSDRTVYKIKKEQDIRSFKKANQWYWSLADKGIG